LCSTAWTTCRSWAGAVSLLCLLRASAERPQRWYSKHGTLQVPVDCSFHIQTPAFENSLFPAGFPILFIQGGVKHKALPRASSTLQAAHSAGCTGSGRAQTLSQGLHHAPAQVSGCQQQGKTPSQKPCPTPLSEEEMQLRGGSKKHSEVEGMWLQHFSRSLSTLRHIAVSKRSLGSLSPRRGNVARTLCAGSTHRRTGPVTIFLIAPRTAWPWLKSVVRTVLSTHSHTTSARKSRAATAQKQPTGQTPRTSPRWQSRLPARRRGPGTGPHAGADEEPRTAPRSERRRGQLCRQPRTQHAATGEPRAPHRITEWSALEGPSVGHPVQPSCPSRVTYSRLQRTLSTGLPRAQPRAWGPALLSRCWKCGRRDHRQWGQGLKQLVFPSHIWKG